MADLAGGMLSISAANFDGLFIFDRSGQAKMADAPSDPQGQNQNAIDKTMQIDGLISMFLFSIATTLHQPATGTMPL